MKFSKKKKFSGTSLGNEARGLKLNAKQTVENEDKNGNDCRETIRGICW